MSGVGMLLWLLAGEKFRASLRKCLECVCFILSVIIPIEKLINAYLRAFIWFGFAQVSIIQLAKRRSLHKQLFNLQQVSNKVPSFSSSSFPTVLLHAIRL